MFQRPANERAADLHGGNDARKDEIALETVRTVLDTRGRFLIQGDVTFRPQYHAEKECLRGEKRSRDLLSGSHVEELAIEC